MDAILLCGLDLLCGFVLSCVHLIVSCFQDNHIGGCSGFHLCDLCHVLCAVEFRSFSDRGASQQSQTPSVCQRSQTSPLLGGQLYLGYGQ